MRDMLAAMLVKSGNDAATVDRDARGRHRGAVRRDDEREGPRARSARHPLREPARARRARAVLDRGRPRRRSRATRCRIPSSARSSRRRRSRSARRATATCSRARTCCSATTRAPIGVKTGNTDSAGYSVVSAARRGGVTLYAVVLGTSSDPQRFRDARELLDWGFAHYRPQSLASVGHDRGGGAGERLPRRVGAGRDLAGRLGHRARPERHDSPRRDDRAGQGARARWATGWVR